MAGLLPALLVAVTVIVADLVLSLPKLFASLPEGPPVGIGIGVSLLLLGAILGIEPRAHEGYLPKQRARRVSRTLLLGVAGGATLALLIALVMIVGRVFTTGWAFSLMTFANALVSALLLAIVLTSALRRERAWYVFSTAVVAALVIAALADNTLGLQFAAPLSFASGFVYLPFLVAAFGLMISRSFVRSMPVSFRRTDWLVYTVRAFEFSALMHAAAVVWHLLAAIAATAGQAPGGTVLHLIDAVVCACFVVVSLFGRTSLLSRPAVTARASGVVAALVLVVVGFLDVIVNSLAMAAGAGLVTGGVALFIGLGAALMLTVPAPVRTSSAPPTSPGCSPTSGPATAGASRCWSGSRMSLMRRRAARSSPRPDPPRPLSRPFLPHPLERPCSAGACTETDAPSRPTRSSAPRSAWPGRSPSGSVPSTWSPCSARPSWCRC